MQPFTPQLLPLSEIAWEPLIPLIGKANRSIAQYDGVLYGVPNPGVLLSPLTTQEAVLSSRIEGTQATLGEVLKFEAGEQPRNNPLAVRGSIIGPHVRTSSVSEHTPGFPRYAH